MQKLRTFLEISGVILFHFIEIMNILLEFDYLRVLSLCSAPSCHHHKWSWMSIVSISGSLPSTSVRHMSGGRCSVVDFVNSFIDEFQQFQHRCCNWSDFDEALLSEAKRSCDQKIKVAFRFLKFKMKLKPWDEVKIHGKENQMLRWRLRSWSWGSERRVCERKFVRLRLRPSTQNLLRSLRQRGIWGECRLSQFLARTNIVFWRVWGNDWGYVCVCADVT